MQAIYARVPGEAVLYDNHTRLTLQRMAVPGPLISVITLLSPCVAGGLDLSAIQLRYPFVIDHPVPSLNSPCSSATSRDSFRGGDEVRGAVEPSMSRLETTVAPVLHIVLLNSYCCWLLFLAAAAPTVTP